jgi:hypothetical protein
MTTRTAFLLVALLVPSCWRDARAADPVAVIKGPTARNAGQSILLDARESVSDKPLRWKLLDRDLPLLTFDSAPRKHTYAFLPDPDPGEYIFALTAVGKVGEELESETAIHRVVVGGSPPRPIPPGPTPPTPGPPGPDSGLGLAAYVRDVVARAVPAADRVQGALWVAAAYREAVRLGRDGKFASPQVMITFLKEAMKTARPASWSGFTLEPKLVELDRAGRLKTTADLARAFEEIAVTLEQIADGQ